MKTDIAEREQVFETYRRWGYLQAGLDPLGYFQPEHPPELEIDGQEAEAARRYYCGAIGVEFAHIRQAERREWICERMEGEPPELDREFILERLIRGEYFEIVAQTRYLGTKRYSLEGITALIPLLDEMLDAGGEAGMQECVIAMSHRGRLNVVVNIVNKAAAEVFSGFEDFDPRSVLGSGDVKYHLGATGTCQSRSGHKVRMHLVSNPSHLEAVDPVALGRVRAKQTRMGKGGRKKIVPIVLHGDAAFAGQGIWAETLNFSGLPGYDVGGAVHVIVNNLIGFTTMPAEAHASRFASDLARRLSIPIFHVNAEDPDAVVRVGRMAMEYRYRFATDVIVDLIGYRRHGHSEVDDPTITQPLLYKRIQDHAPVWQSYGEKIGADAASLVKKVRAELEAEQKRAQELKKPPLLYRKPDYWSAYKGGRYKPEYEVDTGVAGKTLRRITEGLTSYPEGFHIHPKVKKLLEQRAEMGRGEKPVDYGMAEALAFGTLLTEGVPVRLSGQDTRRGTFNQRHSALVDTETEEVHMPLAHLAPDQAWVEIYNSILSEAGVLGFEYGFSRDYPEALVLWEAQFGDFANGAQVIIDQFISAGEDKWGLLGGIVLLLPHGYEGQGPEHSSARIERFLQLAAEDNMEIAQPSTAAQYFHLLRRQALRRWRKPLVVFTPKGMLRHPSAMSAIEEFTEPRFRTVLPDEQVGEARRILICSGKVGHELRRQRKQQKSDDTAIVFLEQLYPFPAEALAAELDRHGEANEIVWVQEEPANMGALFYVVPRIKRISRGRHVRTVKRSGSASPATGSAKAHEMEQKTLLTLAFASSKAHK